MNKQEQKRKLSQVICGNCEGNVRTHCSCPQVDRILQAGYINGADFVEWLKAHFVLTIEDLSGHKTTTTVFDEVDIALLKESLQQYLKGE